LFTVSNCLSTASLVSSSMFVSRTSFAFLLWPSWVPRVLFPFPGLRSAESIVIVFSFSSFKWWSSSWVLYRLRTRWVPMLGVQKSDGTPNTMWNNSQTNSQ
jgi:hypothetical protein